MLRRRGNSSICWCKRGVGGSAASHSRTRPVSLLPRAVRCAFRTTLHPERTYFSLLCAGRGAARETPAGDLLYGPRQHEGGMTIGYKSLGGGDHRVLVLHGWFGDETSFAPMQDALSAGEFTYVFMAYRGYGASRQQRG